MQEIASHFRKPEGALGTIVADAMHEGHAADYGVSLAALQLRRGDRLLEIGMGNGRHVPDLIAAGIRYCGVDHSIDMMRAASARASAGRFICGDACAMEFPACDKALAVNTLQWWSAPTVHRYLERARCVPSGVLVIGITTPIPFHVVPDYGQRHYSRNELATMLGAAGFSDISVREVSTPLRPYFVCRGQA